MAWTLPRLLRGVGADLVHTQYAVPLRCPCPAVVTVHDVSFARDAALMGRKDRLVFRRVVPRAVRAAARVLTVSERTKADLVELYDIPPEHIVVTPNGVDPAFHRAESPSNNLSLARTSASDDGEAASNSLLQGSYVLSVGAIQARKNQLAALEAAEAVGLPLVVVGPTKDAVACGRAAPTRCAARGLCRHGAARRPVPRCRVSRAVEPATRASGFRSWRRWRPGHPSSRCPTRRCARSPATRRSSRRRASSPTESGALSPSAIGSSPRVSNARARSRGARPPSGRSPCTGRYSAREGLGRRRLARARRRARALAARARSRRSTRRS